MRFIICVLLIFCGNLTYGMNSMSKNQTGECISEYSFILGVSKVAGIGVFATHDIPKGTMIFFIEQKVSKIKDVPEKFLPYVVYLNDEECLRPMRFDRMSVLWYINHSNNPNAIDLVDTIIAAKDIKAGEEILVDYNQLNEPDSFKEPYYFGK